MRTIRTRWAASRCGNDRRPALEELQTGPLAKPERRRPGSYTSTRQQPRRLAAQRSEVIAPAVRGGDEQVPRPPAIERRAEEQNAEVSVH